MSLAGIKNRAQIKVAQKQYFSGTDYAKFISVFLEKKIQAK
ncbi:hypothetical protein [Dokdonia sp. Dokd-P16]|nr:hypothetical protein [Dokdonia sp. Dokd-P16]